jgi:hypothetical protein
VRALYVIVKWDGPDAEFVEIEDEHGRSVRVPASERADGVTALGPLYQLEPEDEKP